jgi:putative membrane-bound dehydrogenase-like protein
MRLPTLAAGGLLLVPLTLGLIFAGDRPDQPPKLTPKRTDVRPFKYAGAKVPFYPPTGRGGKVGAPLTQMQLPVEPAESVKHMVTPVDFDVKLFAAEPKIKRPICMNWDERGRLWIAESVDYPNNLQRQGNGHDRIVICEDTDADGTADKFTVFADKLSIPTSLTFANGGVIVTQAPHTLFLKDTDGDGVADERRVLFTGWHTGDTHAGPSNLLYGFDNWVYGMVGYSGFDGVVGGERHSFRQGFFRFRPDGSKLEFLRGTNNNSWGLGFSEEGLLFGSTANGNPSVYMPIPNRYYERVRGWSSRVLSGIAGNAAMHPITENVRQVDFHGHVTPAAGHALYTARTYPKQYWNRTAFITEPTGHLVATFVLDRKGADFTSRNAWNLLASDDEWTAPTMAEVGPDGNVWVIDWYNYIVQHNPTPTGFKTGRGNAYETDLRDRTHGRVYRLVAKGGTPRAAMTLGNATPDKLVATLKHDNLFWRRHAQRLLVERGKTDVVPALVGLAKADGVDEIGLNVGAIHALWTLHGLGAIEKDAAARDAAAAALKHRSAGVRRTAVLVLPPTEDAVERLLASGVLTDGDAQVRLAALLKLADLPGHPAAATALAGLMTRPDILADAWLPDALTAAAAKDDLRFLTATAGGKRALPERGLQIVTTVAEHYARGGPTETAHLLLAPLAAAEPKVAETIIAGMAKGWPLGKTVALDAKAEAEFARVVERIPTPARGSLFKLAIRWGNKGIEKRVAETSASLLAAVNDENQSVAERVAAARQAVELQPESGDIAAKLLEALTPRTPPTVAAGIVDALAASRSGQTGTLLVGRLPTFSPQTRLAAIRVLLARPESTRALLDAIDQGKAPLTELTLDQKQALAAHPDRRIAFRSKKLLARGGGLPSPDRQKVLEQLLPLTKRTGDAAAGKLVFKKHCTACHVHGGEGNKVGPDLSGVAAHTKEHLLNDILDPSRSVEGNFRVYTITTLDGRALTGLLASETKTSVELYDSQGKKQVLLREDIEQITASNKSLMPEGFEKQLTPDEMVNLLTFLTQRGRFVPLPLDKVATAVSTRGMFWSKDAGAERLIFPAWTTQTFKGVPFHLTDPHGDKVPNVVMLYGPSGQFPPKMPRAVKLDCHLPATAIHLLSGVSGWGYPGGRKGSVTMIVRLHYADGQTEDHPLRNGEHFADYIRRVDVPGSEFAFALRGQQIRYLAVHPKRSEPLTAIELVKGDDATAPVVMAVTVETRPEQK